MHSLVDSCMCLDWGLNPQVWHIGMTLTNWTTWPGLHSPVFYYFQLKEMKNGPTSSSTCPGHIRTDCWSSGQDGGIGRNPSLPRSTNLKSINNQKCQKIKLHETPTTKELKKKSIRTIRPVRRQTMRADSETNCGEVETLHGAGCLAQRAAWEWLT